jgi:hypothetical protein
MQASLVSRVRLTFWSVVHALWLGLFCAAIPTVADAQAFNFAIGPGFSPFAAPTFVSASGTITATSLSPGVPNGFAITGINGTVTDPLILSEPTRPIIGGSGSFTFDGPETAGTISFAAGSGPTFTTYDVVFNFGPNPGFSNATLAASSGSFGFATLTLTPQVAAVPGPVTGAGLIPLLGLAGTWYARRRKQLAA